MSRVSIVGLGYVGLPLALLAAKKGHEVTGIDLSEDKIKKINAHKDPLNDEYVKNNIRETKMRATTSFDSIKLSDVVIVCVPTPVKHDYQPDLGPLKGAVSEITKNIKKGSLLIIESTINPGVCDEIVIPLAESESGLKVNKDFYISRIRKIQ